MDEAKLRALIGELETLLDGATPGTKSIVDLPLAKGILRGWKPDIGAVQIAEDQLYFADLPPIDPKDG